MRYFVSRLKQDTEERIYRIYVTDSLFYHAQNKTPAHRYYDLLHPKVETKSADEIISDVLAKGGLKVE